jgi:hypothetical protein
MIISTTAKQRGFGTSIHKSVVFLTPEEREAGKKGVPVLYNSGRLSGGNHGTPWRVAIWLPRIRKFVPRVPNAEMMKWLG